MFSLIIFLKRYFCFWRKTSNHWNICHHNLCLIAFVNKTDSLIGDRGRGTERKKGTEIIRIFILKASFFPYRFFFYRFAWKITSRATQSVSVLDNTLLLKKNSPFGFTLSWGWWINTCRTKFNWVDSPSSVTLL